MNLQQNALLVRKQNKQVEDAQINILAFQLEQQIYTLPIEIIDQIIDMVFITRLPELNDSIEGVFNYHNITVPVVNLRMFLNLPKLPPRLHTPIILVVFSGHIVGLIVDKVIGVISHSQNSIFLPQDLLPGNLGEISILDGLIQTPENYMLMLNLENLFSSRQKQILTDIFDHLTVPAQTMREQQPPADTHVKVPVEIMPVKIDQAGVSGDGDHHLQQKRNHKPRVKNVLDKSVEMSSVESNSIVPQEGID
jgi:purine-binding chemotaxis protein CheW